MYFERIYDFDNLYRAFLLARKGKRWKHTTAKFDVNMVESLLKLSDELKTKTYKPAPYHTFKVYEPKERDVMSNSFRDKVVQHSLCDNVLEPLISKAFIYDNAASQKGKGTHFALDRLEEFMRSYYRKLRRKSKNNMARKLRKFRKLLDDGKIEMANIEQSYQSWKGHASKGNCHHLIRNMDKLYKSLFKEVTQNGTTSISSGGGVED